MKFPTNKSVAMVALVAFMTLVPYLACSGQANPKDHGTSPCDVVLLDEGMPLIVTAVTDLSSNKNKPGDPAQFTVLQPCKVNGVVLVKKGAQVQGRVDQAAHSKMFGKPGTLVVSFQTAQAIDGSMLRVRASLGRKGNQAGTQLDKIGSMLPYGVGLAFNGRDASLKAGLPLTIFVDQDARFLTSKDALPKRLTSPKPSASGMPASQPPTP